MKPLQTEKQYRFLFLGFSIFWLLFVGVFALVMWADRPADMSSWLETQWFGLAMLILFLLIGIGMFILAIRPLIAQDRMSKAVVSLSKDMLVAGDEFTLDYQQTFKSASEVKEMICELVLRETASYGQGTNRNSVEYEHLAQREVIPGRRYAAGETLYEQRQFRLPKGAMHNFRSDNNRLLWFLKVHINMGGWSDIVEEYPLQVLAGKH
ncbi:MAG: hypothetical protein JXB07_14555 [Anaerolineae bacterium]|nr:hypothetical protein [Anaerolineae bacterium]